MAHLLFFTPGKYILLFSQGSLSSLAKDVQWLLCRRSLIVFRLLADRILGPVYQPGPLCPNDVGFGNSTSRLFSGISFFFCGFWAAIILPVSPKKYTPLFRRVSQQPRYGSFQNQGPCTRLQKLWASYSRTPSKWAPNF